MENGPVDKRECRDLICCILFLVGTVIMFAFFVQGLSEGDPIRLIAPYDNDYFETSGNETRR
jgi:hypothetical protein